MSPRNRHPRNRLLPPGLSLRSDGYYVYTSPIDRRQKGLGTDKAKAVRWANAANVAAAAMSGEVTAAEWVAGKSSKNWGAWLTRYEELLADRELAQSTREGYASMMRRARRQWPEGLAISSIDTAMVAEALRGVDKDEGKKRMSQMYRGWLKDCFDRAIANGWVTVNPVAVTDAPTVAAKRARLTLGHFWLVYGADSTEQWLRYAMALALVTGQRREDIVAAKRKDVRDGHLWVEQQKTGNRVAIPLAIRLDALGMSLADVLEQCKATGILSHYLIHRTVRAGATKPGAPIFCELVTRKFTQAVARLQCDWGDRSPPTFHEIRSLSKRLYDAQGGVSTKELLGHKHQQTADLYGDPRGGWVKVSVR